MNFSDNKAGLQGLDKVRIFANATSSTFYVWQEKIERIIAENTSANFDSHGKHRIETIVFE